MCVCVREGGGRERERGEGEREYEKEITDLMRERLREKEKQGKYIKRNKININIKSNIKTIKTTPILNLPQQQCQKKSTVFIREDNK